MQSGSKDLGRIIRQQRQTVPLTLVEIGGKCGVSASHLGRIERGERFPSAHVLRRIAKPLGFEVDELFTLAGFLSPQDSAVAERRAAYAVSRGVAPDVARALGKEPAEVQRVVLGILRLLKVVAKSRGPEL